MHSLRERFGGKIVRGLLQNSCPYTLDTDVSARGSSVNSKTAIPFSDKGFWGETSSQSNNNSNLYLYKQQLQEET